MRIAEAMSPNPICCTESCPAQIAANLMEQVEHGIIPVLERAGRRMVGVLTDRDLCIRVLGQGREGTRTVVGDCMTRNPLYCHAGDDVYLVLEIMTRYGLRGMVVLNDRGDVRGVVSTVALANKLAAASKALCAALDRLQALESESQLKNAATHYG